MLHSYFCSDYPCAKHLRNRLRHPTCIVSLRDPAMIGPSSANKGSVTCTYASPHMTQSLVGVVRYHRNVVEPSHFLISHIYMYMHIYTSKHCFVFSLRLTYTELFEHNAVQHARIAVRRTRTQFMINDGTALDPDACSAILK